MRRDEFWVRGHMPDYPLMPGVLMCEAAAQLCSLLHHDQSDCMQGDFLGFGGMENVRFRGPVRPGDRLVLIAKGIKMHRRQTIFNVQGFVGCDDGLSRRHHRRAAVAGRPASRGEEA